MDNGKIVGGLLLIIVALIVFLSGSVFLIYSGIKDVVEAAKIEDVPAGLISWGIVKIIFAVPVSVIVACIFGLPGVALIEEA